MVNSWSTGFQAQITVTNTGTSAINGWKLTWTFPGDQLITSLWNATYVQSGEQITATNQPYNSSIAPSSSVTVGFTGSFKNSDTSPASFAVNGTACAA